MKKICPVSWSDGGCNDKEEKNVRARGRAKEPNMGIFWRSEFVNYEYAGPCAAIPFFATAGP